jgi:hypothetical protein
MHRLALVMIALRATASWADDIVTDEQTGPFKTIATLCEAWKSSGCRPVKDDAHDFTESNQCTCRLLDTLAKPRSSVIVLDQVIDDRYANGAHLLWPLRDYAIALWRDDGWWLSKTTLPVEMHGGALASNCCDSHAGPPWYSFKPAGDRVVLQTGQDIWRTPKTTGGWQPFVEPHAIWSGVMVCDAKQCSVVPVAHCRTPARAVYRITGDRVETGCSDATLTPFELPRAS